MGKKDKNKKKGQGIVKTAAKTEKKLTLKQKKELAAIGEDDIEKIVTQIEDEEKKRQQVVEHVLPPPSRRVNCSLTAHPDKEELIMFGGEYFNGQKTLLYNDLYFYNITRNEWLLVKAPASPPPRCGHQAVALSAGKGQLWIFGGEYASPTQSQFYHYKDLWVYHLATKKWEKISATGGPSPRSGHRMVHVKKQLIVFGGFHDNLRDYKYFNDVYLFDLETYAWRKLSPAGSPPPPRSGCQMIALADGRVLVYGGYSKEKIKKDVDKGTIHTDMFILAPDKNDATGTKWKWSSAKQSGVRVSPRCGTSVAMAPGNKAYTFGGVFDIEESEEDLAGTFYNDLLCLDLEKIMWHSVSLAGKKEAGKMKKKRRKEKGEGDDDEMESDEEAEVTIDEAPVTTTLADDGVFKVTLGPAPTSSQNATSSNGAAVGPAVFTPSPRMNCSLAVKHSTLYLFGGLVEDGDKQITLSDFYSLDLRKLDEWKTLVANDKSTQEWLDSESGSDDESGSDEDSDEDGEEDKDSDDDDDDDDDEEGIPMDVD